MSIFLPYSTEVVFNYFSTLFSLDLTLISDYQLLMLTLISNVYFFVYWFFILYFTLKGVNRVYEKIF